MSAAHNQYQPTPEPVRQHTPTPWTLTPKSHASWIGSIGNNSSDPQLWSVETDYPKGDNLADAELIVTAVNSHASLTARVEELEATLKWIEARDRMWTAPEYEKGNEVLERGPHNIKIRGSYGAAANLVLKRTA